MKRKFLLPILSVCMVVALVSVGFAAWLITGSDTESASGSFVTHEAKNTYFTVKAALPDGEDGKIEFGKGSTSTSNTSPWFNFSDGTSTESLEATFNVVITPDVGFGTNAFTDVAALFSTAGVSSITITLKEEVVGEGDNTKFDTAKTNGYVALPSFYLVTTTESGASETSVITTGTLLKTGLTITLDADVFSVDTSNATATATVKIKFGWGTAFNTKNPFEYYNGFAVVTSEGSTSIVKPGEESYPSGEITYATAQQVGAKNRTAAISALNALNGLNGVKYEIVPAVVLTSNE